MGVPRVGTWYTPEGAYLRDSPGPCFYDIWIVLPEIQWDHFSS